MTPPRSLPDTGHSRAAARTPLGGVGDAVPYNDLRAFPPSFTPALFVAWHSPRQMFHVEHLPDFFVGKTPFLSLLFVL